MKRVVRLYIADLVCIFVVIFAVGCSLSKNDNRPAYDKLSDEGRQIVDTVLSNSYVWEQSNINRVYFQENNLVIREITDSNPATKTYVYKYYYYTLDGSTLISTDIQPTTYVMMDDTQINNMKSDNYNVIWNIEEKQSALAESYLRVFENN